MNRKPLILAAVVLILLTVVPMAQAITFGEPDGNGHRNVGAMILSTADGTKYVFCSGTLIAPQVFLTAAHCTDGAAAFGVAAHDVWVTFDPIFNQNTNTFYRGTYDLNPNFGHDQHDLNDIAVIILDEPITDIEPATLPTAGLLDDMKDAHQLKGQKFVTVGYGLLREDKTKGPLVLGTAGERYYADQTFQSLKPYWLQLSANPSKDNGGSCFGDSGGPHFLGNTNMVVSLTSTGDSWCRATDQTYRVDTDSARSYLSQFVPLP